MAGRVTLGSHLGLGGKSSPGSVLVTGVQGELVKSVLCQTAFWRPHLAHVGEMVRQLLDELELLVQVARLQEVAQVGVAALGGQVVQVEQALADSLLRWLNYWSFSFSPSIEYSVLIAFRIDWFDRLAVQGTVKSLLQHHSSKA